jgi:hypothetical protein
MVGTDSTARLIAALGADMTPVARLTPPTLRALGWLAIVGAIGAGLATFADVHGMIHRLAATPDLGVAAAGSLLTAILAAVAAFQLSLPDRKPAWALLPLPAAALWFGASGLGCLREWVAPETQSIPPMEPASCLMLILGLSVPLSVLLIVMLRRGYSLRPNLTAVIAGVACAAAAATLLNFVHSYDAAATDLAAHAIAVAIVIALNRTFGGRILSGQKIVPAAARQA